MKKVLMIAATAQKLGMSSDQLTQAVQNGQSIEQLAQAKGVSLDELKQAAITALRNSFASLEAHGGSIGVVSEVGHGTTITFQLPVTGSRTH